MKPIFVGFKLEEKDKDLIRKIAQTYFKLTELEVQILNIPFDDLTSIDPDQTPVCFGPRAASSVGLQKHISLPAIASLYDVPENKGARLTVHKMLSDLSKFEQTTSDKELNLSPEDLTKLAQARLNKLQETTSNGQQYWLGTLASGKIIAISDTPLPPTVNCNFQLTFEELHAAQLACNILGLTSLTLVKEKKND